ncbi:MAG TPA: thiamine phosphate synthase, partial [Solirubrobacterales bacterium]|nr:thiamine phosphate synthase [Solirubrobacterales bacterium]
RRVADTFSALFIVNDDPELVRACDADGVHLGQDDHSVLEARELLGPEAIIGLSTHSEEQIATAAALPVDYISVGPIWETPTKAGRPAVGLELVRHAAEHAAHPFFAIGGIEAANAGDVVAAGARRLCAVRAIRDAPDPAAAATELRQSFAGPRGVAPGG